MRGLMFALLLALAVSAQAQYDSGSRISVVGTATKSTALDLLRIRFTIEVKDKSQKTAIQRVGELGEMLSGQLSSISAGDLSEISSSVGEDLDYTSEKSKRIGFSAIRVYELSTIYDPSRFSVMMDSVYALNIRELKVDMDMQLSQNQRNSLDRDLIRAAIADAQRSASVIAESLGLALDGIHSVSYSDSPTGEMAVQPIQKSIAVARVGGRIAIPDDRYVATRTIMVSWYIRRR